MKNFLQVNRALAAEKNFNLIEMLQGCSTRNGMTVSASNPDGQTTVNRQSRVMSQSGCSAVDVPMTSYGAPDEHPMSTRSASDGTRWNSRVWKYVAMIFAVLVMSVANVGMAWGATYTWTFDNSANDDDIDLSSGTTALSSYTTSGKSMSYVGGSSCKIPKKTAYLAMGGESKQSSGALSTRYFILTAPSANGTISVTFAGTASGNELIRTDNGDYQVIAAATSTTKVSSLLSGLTAETTKIYIAFTGKCYISSIAWTDADAPEALTTLYSSDYKSSMESGASISVSSSGMVEQTGGSGWVSAYSKYYKATSTNKEATITFSPALSLVSDGNDRGKIRIYYGSTDKYLNATVINDFKINGGSSIGTAYGVLEKEKVHVIEYTIPVGTSTLTTIYNKVAVSNGCLLHVEVLTHSAGGGCAATANAGADKETTVGVGVAMAATAASSGYTGAWSIKTGSPSMATSQLGTTSSNTMTFTPNTYGTYTLVWTVTDNEDGSCSATDEATVTVPAPTHTITYTNTKSMDNSANPTSYYEGVGVTSFTKLRHAVGYDFTGWSPSSISSSATTDQTIDAQWTARAAAAGTGTLTYALAFESSIITTSSITRNNGALYDATNISTANTSFVSGGEAPGNGCSGKLATTSSKSGSNYVELTFKIADGYTFTPSGVSIQANAVSNNKTLEVELKDNAASPHTKSVTAELAAGSTSGGVTYNLDFSSSPVTLEGTVTLKIYVYGSDGATKGWRIGPSVIVNGTVAEEASCTAPTAVYVTQTEGSADMIAGESFTLSAATSTGVEEGATYQWYRNSTEVGTNSPTFTVPSCTKVDAGTYWCKITNPCSEDAHTTNVTGFGIKVWQVLLYKDSWNAYDLTSTGTKTGEVTRQLTPGTYYIKLTHNNGVDFGVNTGETISEITATTPSAWTLYNGQNKIKVTVTTAGDYTFGVDYTSADYPKLSVTYPPATISSCDKIYFCPTVNSIATGSAKFSIYFYNATQNAWANCYLVDGTDFADDAKYVAYAPAPGGWTGMIVVRYSSYISNWDNKWNQSEDITYNGYNYITGRNEWTSDSPAKFKTHLNSFYSSATPAMAESDYCVVVGGTTTASTNLPSSAVTYTSDNTSVATVVASTGVITGVAAGTATITAKVGTCTVGTATVTVYAAPSVTLSSSSVTYGSSAPTLTPSNFATVTGYSSSTAGTATINGSGVISIVAAGTTTFTVTGTDQCGNAVNVTTGTFTVNKANITPTLSYTSTTLTVGGGNSSNPTVSGNTGNGGVTYSSSNTSVATVNETTGVVTPVAAGSATITATIAATTNYNGNTATANFTINAAASCSGDPTALVSGELYTIDEMVSNCSATAISSTTSGGTGIFQYGLSSNGKFYVVGTTNDDNSTTGTVEMKKQGASTITVKDETFTYIAWFKGSGSTSCRSIKFVTPSAGTLIIYGKVSSGKGNIELKQGSNSAVDAMSNSKNGSDTVHVNITAGATCYIWADGGSAALYGLKFVAAVPCTTAPTVTAGSNTSVTSTTATVSCTGGITSLGTGGCTISSYGFVIGTATGPTIGGSGVTQHEVGTSYASTGTSFSKDLTGLTAETTYYVRPYATNGYGTAYGTETSFTTTAASEAPIPALISYYLQTPNSKTKPTSLSTDSIVTTPKRLKGDTLKNFVPVTLGSSLSITGKGKDDTNTWSAKIGTTPADSATAVTDAYAAKLAFDIHDDYELNISSITLNVKSVTNANQIYRVKVTDGEHTVYGRVAPGKDSDNSVVFGSFSGIKFSGTVTLTLWVWSNAAAEYRLKSPIQIDGTLTRKATACTMPTHTFSTGAYTLGGAALDLSTLFTSNSDGAVTYSVVSAGGTSATIVGSSFTASNTGTATIRATQAADGEGNYCAKSIETTVTVSGTCTPQSLSKVVVTGGSAGTVTGYNGDEYAGSAVISVNGSTTDATNIDGESGNETGYKMTGSGTAIVFATLKKGTFQAGDQVKIGITRRNDTRQVDSKYNVLTIYYGTNKDDATALATINTSGDNDNGAAEHEGAGFYTYTLTAANVTTIGSKKGIGLFRETDNGQNPYVHSVEIRGCRDWTVCTAPDAVAASGATHNSALLTVTDAEETGNYEFYYSTSSTAPTASTVALATGSALTKTISGLTASTTYYYWVRSNCGGVTKSAWVAGTPATFTTTAAPSTYSVTYSATDKTSGSVPEDASTYEEGDIVTVKGNTGSLVKSSSSFVGWNTASDGTGTFYPAGYKFYMGDADVTLYAVWGSVGSRTVNIAYFETSLHNYNSTTKKPDAAGKYLYGYTNSAKTGAYAYTLTTSSTNNVGQGTGASDYLRMDYGTTVTIYADSATKTTPAGFTGVTAVSVDFKMKNSSYYTTFDIYVGSTKIADNVSLAGDAQTAFKTYTYSGLSNLDGVVKIVNKGSGSSNYHFYVDNISISYGSGASSGYTVSFDKNGHGSAIADIENVPSGSKIGAPVPAPTAADYAFLGWYREAGGTNAWNFGTMTITKDTTLYAKWGSCAPTITTHPVAANYNQNGVASALTVVAATNGGGDLNYQWWVKENNLAEEDGSAISGETGNSFTPSTELLGTSYYYCVVSNDCGNVKTNTAAVTIRDAKPDPTAVWDVEEPTHGGKGFTFSVVAKQNDEETLWDGTLTADMLSVSSEAVLGTVTVDDDTKTISGTYGVKGSATSPVTFYLLLPATETQAAARLDHDQSFNVCAGGGSGTTYNIPMLSAYSSTSSGKPTYHCATAGVGYIAPEVGASSVTLKAEGYDEFSYYTSSGRQSVLVYSEKDAIKKMRIYLCASGGTASVESVGTKTGTYSTNTSDYVAFRSDDYDVTYTDEDGNDGIGKGSNGYIELTFATPLEEETFVYVVLEKNAKFFGAKLIESEGGGTGETQSTTLAWASAPYEAPATYIEKDETALNFTYTATRSGANAEASLGTIVYYSSDESVATVNASTGEVSIADDISWGDATFKDVTITAMLSASGCYEKAELSYTVRVERNVCEEAQGTIAVTSSSCSSWELAISGYAAGATISWYKEGTVAAVKSGSGSGADTYSATTAGTYYAVTNATCEAISTNEIKVSFTTATATKIVDKWYVKNDRRTPDIALVQTTNATGFTVTSSGDPVTSIGGCTFELKKDGIIYLHGMQDNGDAPSDMTPGDMTITITATACTPATSLDIVLHIQAETTKPSVAFVVDGTLRKDGGTATSVLAAKTSDRPLWKYLENTFTLTGCNAYWSVDSKELRQYYSQFDAILITDDPSTSTNGTGGVSYVKAFGTMVDVRPILTMEAYVGKFKDGGWHVYNANPTSPDPRQVELKLECKNHDIFKGLNPESSTNVRTTTDALGNEYWHVIMVDTTLSPYHNTTSNYEALPALQGFDPTKFDKMLGVGTIFDGKLQGGVERQEEPAARMMILGIQNNAMGALTNEGKLIVKNAIEYLLKTNMEDVNDCSNYFVGGTDGHEREWHNLGNWTGDQLPDFETRARILAPVEISTNVRVAHIDIIAGGESGKVDNPEGSVTVKPTGTLIVSGTINRAKAPYYGIDDLMPTTPSDLILETNNTSQSALIFDNSNGETQATVQVYSKSYKDGSDNRHWQYLTSPLQETPVTEFFYGIGTYTFKYEEARGGWVQYNLGTTFDAFDAIGLTQAATKTFRFYGPLASTEDRELNLTYGSASGENMFGNSWTAPIQLTAFTDADFTGGVEKTFYVYNTGFDLTPDDNHADASATAGQWQSIPLSSLAVLTGDGAWTGLKVIPAYQAYYVKCSSAGTITLNYDKHVRPATYDTNEPLRAPRRMTGADSEVLGMRISVQNDAARSDIYLLESDQFTEGFDNGWDGNYFSGDANVSQFYSLSPMGKMAVSALPDLDGTILGFDPAKKNEEYTFTFHCNDGEYYLNDLKLEQSTLIQTDESYTFTMEEGDSANRFYISATPFDKPGIATGVTDLDADAPKVQKIIYNDKLYIIRGGKVFSADGQLVR